jgi:hypothetical protein
MRSYEGGAGCWAGQGNARREGRQGFPLLGGDDAGRTGAPARDHWLFHTFLACKSLSCCSSSLVGTYCRVHTGLYFNLDGTARGEFLGRQCFSASFSTNLHLVCPIPPKK